MNVPAKPKPDRSLRWPIGIIIIGLAFIWLIRQDDPIPIAHSDFVVADLVHSVQTDRRVTLTLPRAAIVFADPDSRRWFSDWPSHLRELNALHFAVVYPSGKAVGDVSGGARGIGDRYSPLRSLVMKADVHLIGRNILTNIPVSVARHKGPSQADLPDFDGLKSFGNLNSAKDAQGKIILGQFAQTAWRTYFLPTSDHDNFDLISCYDSPAKSFFFCTYSVRVNEMVWLSVSFVDFRFHGGRKFANDYMRLILQKYCEYEPTCDWHEGEAFRKKLLPIED
jgi:hypothetical protein